MITKEWHIAEKAPASFFHQHPDMKPVLAQLLYNRGILTPTDAALFLTKQDPKDPLDPREFIDPFDFKDMTLAVDRILQALDADEKIVVYGDFDADGVTATTLMMQVLIAMGANARAYIPHRIDEGYGLNSEALAMLAQEGTQLVITVDCGIRSVQEIEEGKSAGLDIIITDHHSVGPVIPQAYAVVNPQQEDCQGDNRIAGVGVALMVAHALLKTLLQRKGRNEYPDIRYSDLLDLVAIGTVADIMPLNAPINRMWVKSGLSVMQEGRRAGLNALLKVASIAPDKVDAMSIGFGIGPRINAAGRLDSAMQAYELLSAPNASTAIPLAQNLQRLNIERQNITRESHARITEKLESTGGIDANLIIAEDEEIPQGIVGLVAGRLAQSMYRPTIVLERGVYESHASCRSIPEFHITKALDQCADLLLRHGGHAMAAGLTIMNDNIPAFKEKMRDLADAKLNHLTLVPKIDIDMELSFDQLTMELIETLSYLEPTGHANPAPLFLTRNLNVKNARTIGADNAHLKLTLSANRGAPIDAIAFRMGALLKDLPDTIDVAYQIELNEWNGRTNLQMNIRDIHLAT